MEHARYDVGDEVPGRGHVLSVHRGFLGIVYICRDRTESGTPLYSAVKTFRFDEELHRALFRKEVENWLRLPEHPHVVRAIEANREEKLLILELVYGPSLKAVCSRRPLHPRHFLRWAREIAAALRFLHVESRFVHRDVRPPNVLVDIRGGLAAKLSDLGIGKHLDPDAASHTTIGTFQYMAPEVFQGRTDYRSDVFSFGALLYDLLTGRSAVRWSTRHLRVVTSPHEWVAEIPEPVERLVLRSLERDPLERPQSMDEILEALSGLPEWPVAPGRYVLCHHHAYEHFVLSPDDRCPFCKFEEDFVEREGKLDRRLAHRSRPSRSG